MWTIYGGKISIKRIIKTIFVGSDKNAILSKLGVPDLSDCDDSKKEYLFFRINRKYTLVCILVENALINCILVADGSAPYVLPIKNA